MADPPNKEYQTYTMQDQKPISGDIQNHLEYRKEETNIDASNGYSSQVGYRNEPQEQHTYQQPPQRPSTGRVLPAQPTEPVNPFRQQQEPPAAAAGRNPFRQGFN